MQVDAGSKGIKRGPGEDTASSAQAVAQQHGLDDGSTRLLAALAQMGKQQLNEGLTEHVAPLRAAVTVVQEDVTKLKQGHEDLADRVLKLEQSRQVQSTTSTASGSIAGALTAAG